MYAARNYQQGPQRLLAACDEDLLGKRFTDGKFILDVTPTFYDELRIDDETLEAFLAQCSLANLVGPKCVAKAVDLGLVAKEHIINVDGVPHAQLLVMET